MSAESLVRDEVTRFGQHWVEVMRMGGRVERERWLGRAPNASWHLVKAWEREEGNGLGVWRLYVWWPAREVVRLSGRLLDTSPPGPLPYERGGGRDEVQAVLWFLEKGQNVRNGLENAAACMWLELGRWPGRAYLGQMPKGAEERVELVDEPGVAVELGVLPWVPKGYVLVV
jgi:hypothetical protein